MYAINTNKYKKASFFFGAIFLLMISFFPFVYNFLSFSLYYDLKVDSKVNATMYVNEKDKKMKKSVYTYKINGKEYQYIKDTKYKNENLSKIKNEKLYCNSSNPSNCTTTNPIVFFIIVSIIFVILLGIWLFFLYVTIREIKIIQKIKKLQENGILIKKHPYQLVNDAKIKFSAFDKAILNYTLPSGKTIQLQGEIRMIYQTMSYEDSPYDANEKKIDLLIDEKNPRIFVLDSNINRTKENLPEDYYQKKK